MGRDQPLSSSIEVASEEKPGGFWGLWIYPNCNRRPLQGRKIHSSHNSSLLREGSAHYLSNSNTNCLDLMHIHLNKHLLVGGVQEERKRKNERKKKQQPTNQKTNNQKT